MESCTDSDTVASVSTEIRWDPRARIASDRSLPGASLGADEGAHRAWTRTKGIAAAALTLGFALAGCASGFGVWAERLPYLSGGLVMTMGLVVTLRGLWMLGLQ